MDQRAPLGLWSTSKTLPVAAPGLTSFAFLGRKTDESRFIEDLRARLHFRSRRVADVFLTLGTDIGRFCLIALVAESAGRYGSPLFHALSGKMTPQILTQT